MSKALHYGLPSDNERRAGGKKGKPGVKLCLFCNADIGEPASSLCFANFVACQSCLELATAPEAPRLEPGLTGGCCWDCQQTPNGLPVWHYTGKPYNAAALSLGEDWQSAYGLCLQHAAQRLESLKAYLENSKEPKADNNGQYSLF